jgi:hypothetical protein
MGRAADIVGAHPEGSTTVFDDNGSFLLATLEFFIFFAWFMSLFWIFGDLFRSRDLGGLAKTLWTLFLIVLPIVGMLAYLIARGHGMAERSLDAQAQAQAQQEAYIRKVAASNGSTAGATDKIYSAKTLLDSGAINAAEFDRLKSDALGKAVVA